MTAGEMRKLLEQVPDDGNVHFNLGDVATPLEVSEDYTTGTKDAAYIEFHVPPDWTRK